MVAVVVWVVISSDNHTDNIPITSRNSKGSSILSCDYILVYDRIYTVAGIYSRIQSIKDI